MPADLDALREALNLIDKPLSDHPLDAEAPFIVIAAAREFLRLMETAETVWYCLPHRQIDDSESGCWVSRRAMQANVPFCRMVSAVLIRRTS